MEVGKKRILPKKTISRFSGKTGALVHSPGVLLVVGPGMADGVLHGVGARQGAAGGRQLLESQQALLVVLDAWTPPGLRDRSSSGLRLE